MKDNVTENKILGSQTSFPQNSIIVMVFGLILSCFLHLAVQNKLFRESDFCSFVPGVKLT